VLIGELRGFQQQLILITVAVVSRAGEEHDSEVHVVLNRAPKARKYESQGQVRSEAKHVAPGCHKHEEVRPERPKYHRYYALSGLHEIFNDVTQGRRARSLALAPGCHIARLRRSLSTFCAKLIQSNRR
jgi:hypothetical protein